MIKVPKKFKDYFFYLFLLFAVFGVFLLYMAWMWLKHPATPNPAGADYVIPFTISEQYPDALCYDFEKTLPDKVTQVNQGHSGKKSLLAAEGNYSPAVINVPLESFSEKQLSYIRLSAWVYADQVFTGNDARLVMLITNPLREVKYSKSVRIVNNPKGQWFQINTWCEPLSYLYNRDDRLRIYFKNTTETRLLCDDLMVQFGKGTFSGKKDLSGEFSRGKAFGEVNTPPYKPRYLKYAGSPSGIKYETPADSNSGLGEILKADIVLTGSFFNHESAAAEIFAMGSSGIYIYRLVGISRPVTCRHFAVPEAFDLDLNALKATSGDFDGDRLTEAFLWDPESGKAFMAGGVNNGKSATLDFVATPWPKSNTLQTVLALDADRDRTTELLVVETSGNWQLLKFLQGQWAPIAASKTPRNEWRYDKNKAGLVVHAAGTPSAGPYILSIGQPAGSPATQYGLFVYDRKAKDFSPVFLKNNGWGMYVGKDRFGMKDQLVPFGMKGGNSLQFLRIRDDWRWDVKLLSMNDTSYCVEGSLDFRGFTGDNNPKYSEKIKLLPYPFRDGRQALIVLYGPADGHRGVRADQYGIDFYVFDEAILKQ